MRTRSPVPTNQTISINADGAGYLTGVGGKNVFIKKK